jgi:hypothetical protein
MRFGRAALFGLVAAVLGAVLYYAVIAITNFEIGIVAIAIGFMVGYAVRKGAHGGGRRFQVLAVALTYWAVGLAYTPVVFRAMAESRQSSEGSAVTQDAPPLRQAAPADAPEATAEINLPLVVAYLLLFTLALPVLTVFGSLPGGLISAAIIAFGMMQAWRMTGVPQLLITGPYQIASGPPASV